ncbi:MAG: helix-turn-helix transcriptional regulator [Rhodospirillales bacterium]|nr:helix-turn-helix transcriptional regulator [Alphaproteobacteria bacterium]MCB9986169.1 helix-turn-helix transcriptional regulator [Rhodospirillales bacterium]USO07274.1 MAG: helix-turn-helix transcriptional regulator [Rhodospirillales bacterium]
MARRSKPKPQRHENLMQAVGLLKLLAHPVRLSILCNLLHRGELSVGDIVDAEDGRASQSQVSQFLGKMRSEGLVTSRKVAQTVYYRLDSAPARAVIQYLYDTYCGNCQ